MPSDLSQKLTADSVSIFYEALSQVQSLSEEQFRVMLCEALTLLSSSETLPERRKGERAATILSRRAIALPFASELVKGAGDYSPSVRNALAGILPAELRAKAWDSPVVDPSKDGAEDAVVQAPTEPAHAVVPASAPIAQGSAPGTGKVEPVGPGSASIVLLLSTSSDQDGNLTLLRNVGFDPIHFELWDAARTDIANMADISGFVIDGSFIRDLEPEQQFALFKEISSYSTFTWIRVDETGLRIGIPDLRETIRKSRCLLAPLHADAISVRPGGTLQESEIPDLLRAQSIIRSHVSARVHPRQLSATEGQLLIAALWKTYEENRYDRSRPAGLLEVEFLTGGYSSARTVLVRIEGAPRPEIAKVNSRPSVVEEVERFFAFIHAWDPELQPRAFFHADAAMVLFGIISEEHNRAQPAAMLAQCLEELWNSEVFAATPEAFQKVTRQSENLTVAVRRTAEKLCSLNRTRVPPTDFLPHGYPSPTVLQNLRARGIEWSLPDEVERAISKATARFNLLHPLAIVHGDLHLGNVLVRGDRDPHLIDYASSGPGHPALDLVRLELALYLGFIRQFESEEHYISFQRAFSLERKNHNDLELGWPKVFQCATNRVCLHGCVAARDYALEAVHAHGGGEKDYLAAKFLVSLQNLVMHRRQTSLTRSVIHAVAPEISSWD